LRNHIAEDNVLVLDDFITEGNSFECARNLLFAAGAANVVCVSIGKYGQRYNLVTIKSEFNPFAPIDSSKIKYERTPSSEGEINNNVTAVLEESFDIQ
jgi:hypothetical protein